MKCRILLATAVTALMLVVTQPVDAQDFEAGLAAYDRGDYAAALQE